MKPATHYTKSGRINIAYQVYGEGPIDLIYVPGWVSNIDLMWRNPQLVAFLTALAQHARIILFDKRGTGLSDRVTELSTLEERMDDIRAVMDAVGCQRAVLFGHSEGGSVSALFAATYPNRTLSLITFGVFARRRYSPEYPWAPTDEERQEVYDMIDSSWGSGDMNLASLAPSMAHDPFFMDWLASYFRSGASPSAALVLTKMNTEVDIIDILYTIEVPTLLLYRTDDIDVKVEEGRFISERIKESKFCEFPGNDHLFWVGDTKVILDEIRVFLSRAHRTQVISKVLATILILEIKKEGVVIDPSEVGKHRSLEGACREIIRRKVEQYRGTLHSYRGGLYTATFDGPSKTVHCALDIRASLKKENLEVAQGIHTGECVLSGKGNVAGMAVQFAQKIQSRARSSQILISNTVKHLLSGAGLEFIPSQKISQGTTHPTELFVVNEFAEPSRDIPGHSNQRDSLRNHSFLENVIQSIESHLDDDQYSVGALCDELGISERQLQRKLKSIANKSPNQMVRSVRLHRAKDLIVQQKMAISDAAYQTGFSTVSYFTKCFKKEFGVTPSVL